MQRRLSCGEGAVDGASVGGGDGRAAWLDGFGGVVINAETTEEVGEDGVDDEAWVDKRGLLGLRRKRGERVMKYWSGGRRGRGGGGGR